MRRDDTAPVRGDLLLQAVEGMDRPLFVLDEDWRFTHVNPAGARVLDREVADLVGSDIWAEFPEAVGAPSSPSTAPSAAPVGRRAWKHGSVPWAGGSARTPS